MNMYDPFSSIRRGYAAQERLEPQEEALMTGGKGKHLFIGIPKVHGKEEKRVPLIPSSVGILTNHGHRFVIEKGLGEKSKFSDSDYSEAGAEIVYEREQVFKADIIIMVSPPVIEDVELLQPGTLLITPLHLPIISKEILEGLLDKKVVAIAMEYLMDNDGTFPLVRIMSELAGRAAILTAAQLLSNDADGPGILLGGISGVPPAKVVILGAGVVGEHACRTALGLGAEISVFDNNVYKLMRLQNNLGTKLFTSSLNPAFLIEELEKADVVIGAIHSKTGRSPIVVTEDMVMGMREDSVIVDVSIDQGGCVETSELTTLSHPTFRKHGVVHYCVPNIASRFGRTASLAFSNILTPILMNAGLMVSIERLIYLNSGYRHGVYIFKGCLTNSYLAERFEMKYTDLDLLLASSF